MPVNSSCNEGEKQFFFQLRSITRLPWVAMGSGLGLLQEIKMHTEECRRSPGEEFQNSCSQMRNDSLIFPGVF